MNRLSILFITILMFLTAPVVAQKKQVISMQWELAVELPALQEHKALGIAGPVAGIHKNKLIVAGGANFPDSMPWQGGKKKYYSAVYVYEKKGNRIMLLEQQFKLPFNIAYAACSSTSHGIVYAGGENENGISNKVFLVQWDKNSSTVSVKQLPELPVAITNAAATVIGNNVYIAGGETGTSVSNQFLSLDLDNTTAGWQQLPAILKPVSHSVLAVLVNGIDTCIYLVGGRKKNVNGISDLYNTTFQFNVKKNQWVEKEPLPYALSAGAGIAINSNNILMLGGDKGETFHQVEALIAAINAEKNETKKKELIQQKNSLQSSHPGFSKDVLRYNAETNSWEINGKIPFDVPVTTIAVKWGNSYIIPSGEIKAGVRSPSILSVKILLKAK